MDESTHWHEGFLGCFSPQVQERMLSLGEPCHFSSGKVIFEEGDASLYLYLVKTGRVAIEVHMPGWGRRTILTTGPGQVFSWSALIEPRIETASARALEDTEVLRIKGGALMDSCREDPKFGFQLYRALAEVISDRLASTRRNLLEGASWPLEAKPSS